MKAIVELNRSRNYRLLVVRDEHISLRSSRSAYERARAIVALMQWPFESKISVPMKGDVFIIYLAGRRDHAHTFVGSGVFGEWHACNDRSLWQQRVSLYGERPWSYLAAIRRFVWYSKPVDISQVKHRLSFIKKPDSPKWGVYMMGSARRITEADYQLVSKYGGRGVHR